MISALRQHHIIRSCNWIYVWPDVRPTSNVIREASPRRTAVDPRTVYQGLIHSLLLYHNDCIKGKISL